MAGAWQSQTYRIWSLSGLGELSSLQIQTWACAKILPPLMGRAHLHFFRKTQPKLPIARTLQLVRIFENPARPLLLETRSLENRYKEWDKVWLAVRHEGRAWRQASRYLNRSYSIFSNSLPLLTPSTSLCNQLSLSVKWVGLCNWKFLLHCHDGKVGLRDQGELRLTIQMRWWRSVLTVFRYLINCCSDCCLHLEHWPKKKLPWTEAREKLGSCRALLDIVLIKFWRWGPREMVDSPLIRKKTDNICLWSLKWAGLNQGLNWEFPSFMNRKSFRLFLGILWIQKLLSLLVGLPSKMTFLFFLLKNQLAMTYLGLKDHKHRGPLQKAFWHSTWLGKYIINIKPLYYSEAAEKSRAILKLMPSEQHI